MYRSLSELNAAYTPNGIGSLVQGWPYRRVYDSSGKVVSEGMNFLGVYAGRGLVRVYGPCVVKIEEEK